MDKYLEKYKLYVEDHRKKVKSAFKLLYPFISHNMDLNKEDLEQLKVNIDNHDKSKFDEEENTANAYAEFYYCENVDDEILENFENAVRFHKINNPHHINYWHTRNQEMPTIYLIEMFCDWWSFSFAKNDPMEILDWYNKNKESINLRDKEIETIQKLLTFVKTLDKQK